MKIFDMAVELVRVVHRLAGKVAQHDRDLAQQLKRACTSAALNASEGVHAKAGKRRSRLEDAVNSARETRMALRLAGACGYLAPHEVAAALQEVDSVIRVLWVLAYRR